MQRIELAKELLSSGEGIVVLDNCVALSLIKGGLLCEVFTYRDENQYEKMIEQGKSILNSSNLAEFIQHKKTIWTVVEDYGMGVAELWREQ